MTSIAQVKAANATIKQEHSSLTAVFVGATSGIGLATLQAFTRHIAQPRAIIIGRSLIAFQRSLDHLKTINPEGHYTFLEADVALIRNVNAVCNQIRSLLILESRKIDLLFTSQGYISFSGREENADGLDNSIALRYYGRIRFTENLLPLMSTNARSISILAGGQEGKIFEDDLDLKQSYSVVNAAAQFASMLTLSFDKLAEQDPEKAFLHVFPGLTSTGLLGRSAKGVLGFVMRWVLEPVISLFASRAEDVGERMLYFATTEKFATGSWSLDWDGTSKENAVLKGYRDRGLAEKVVEHNAKIFQKAA